jgi:hypothetical protein
MRLQLTGHRRQRIATGMLVAASVVVALGTSADDARGDGVLTMGGVYFKERATRVVPPMLDAVFDVGDHGTMDGHVVADVITSASIAAGTMLEETRYEAGGGYQHQLGWLRVGSRARYSTEPDYKSQYGGLNLSAELFERNFTVEASGGIGRDQLDNSGEGPISPRRAAELATYLGSVSIAQILSPNAIGSITYDRIYLDGFQANIYRRVIAGGDVRPELHPEQRTRHAVAGTLKGFLPSSETTAIASYRYYRDDWGIRAHTPELRILQDIGSENVVFGMSYRFHTQTAADFYQAVYATSDDEFVTADPKLSSFRSHTIGARFELAGAALGWQGRFAAMRAEMLIEYFAQDSRFGNAGIVYAALTYPFEN